MSDLDFSLPLRIEGGGESVCVIDRADRVIFYVFVCAEGERRLKTKRLTPEDEMAVAKIAARALTDVIEREE